MTRVPKASSLNCRLVVLAVLVLMCVQCLVVSGQDNGQPTALQAAASIQQVLVDAIEKAESSVVAITRVRKGTIGDPTDSAFVPHEFLTGVVVDKNGSVLTTYRSLGDPTKNDYFVWAQRKAHKVAKVEKAVAVSAADPWTDLAVLKIRAEGLKPIEMGDATGVRKGQLVVTLGDPYAIVRDGEVSATWGMISNLSRRAAIAAESSQDETQAKETLHHFGTLLQIDSRLEFGTSGGAVLDLNGRLIGLTTTLPALSRFKKNAGYAIPIDVTLQRTIKTLASGQAAEFGFLGVGPRNLTLAERERGLRGVVVEQVVPGTPAAQAGIQLGDILTHVNGSEVNQADGLIREVGKMPVQSEVLLRVERGATLLRRGVVIRKTARLTKKYVATRRPVYAQEKPRSWRGMVVDYATAIPDFTSRSHLVSADGCVAVIDVERDSATWKAGLRPWTFVRLVGKQHVTTPDEFYAAISGRQGDVLLELTAAHGEDDATRIVQP